MPWGELCVLTMASHMVYNFACSMYWKPGSLSAPCKLLSRLNTYDPTRLLFSLLLGGMKEPHV